MGGHERLERREAMRESEKYYEPQQVRALAKSVQEIGTSVPVLTQDQRGVLSDAAEHLRLRAQMLDENLEPEEAERFLRGPGSPAGDQR